MIAVVVLNSGGGSRFPRPAKFKTWRPIPSIDPTRSVRGISGVWTAEPIPASMSFERTCAGWRDYRVVPGEQYCERCGTVAETVPHLAVAKACGDSFRLDEKGVSCPIRECEWDKGGGFTKSGPGDSQMHSPRSCFLSVSYGPISGHRVAARGKWRWTGSAPAALTPVHNGFIRRSLALCFFVLGFAGSILSVRQLERKNEVS